MYESTRRERQGDNGTLLEEASTNGRVGGVHQGESKGNGKRDSSKSNGNLEIKHSYKERGIYGNEYIEVEDSEEINSNTAIQYNRKTRTYINNRLSTSTLSSIRNKLNHIFEGVEEGIADDIGIEIGNTIFVLDVGVSDWQIDFGVFKKIVIADSQLRKERLVKLNDRAISKRFISEQILGKIEHSPDNDSGSGIRRKLQKELSTNQGKSTNNERRISQENADRGSGRLKHSYKERDIYGNEYIEVEDSEEINSNTEIRYNRKQTYKNISKQEYAIISSRIMEDNAGNIASDTPLPRYNTARSANYFYVYENFAPGEFGVLKQIRLTDNNRKYIQSIEAKIGENNGESTITSTSELNRVLQVLKNQARNNRRNNVDDSKGRADSTNGGLPLGESKGNGKRDSSKSNGNLEIKHSYKERDIYGNKYTEVEDSEGNNLTVEQYEFFISSKVRDENGNLQVCYHGTEGEFYVFDKALRGSSTGARDAQLGFFFTNSKETAEEYSLYAQDNKLYNLRFKITKGNKELLEKMSNINYAFQMTGSEDIEEYKRLLRKSENFETDVKEVYLNIENPYVEDWEGKQYKKGKMLRTVETAILKGCDGVIIKNIDDSVDYTGAKDNTYIVFDSNQIKLTSNKKPTLKDDIRYSHKESFAKQVDNVLSGQDKINSHLLVLENTPKLLQNIGLPDKPMLITAAHTKTAVGVLVKNKNVHNLNVETFKDLPSLIEKPVIIMDSSDESKNSIVLFVNAKDINGNPVVCSIRVEGEARYNNIKIIGNIVTSVYGKDANPTKFIEKAVKEDRILYWEKKMSQDLFDNPGLQLPDNIFNLDSNIIIRKTRAKVNTLDKNSSNVKFSHKQPVYVFSKGQINKKLADHTRYKVYSKVETEKTLNAILDNLYFDNYDIKITGKQRYYAIA